MAKEPKPQKEPKKGTDTVITIRRKGVPHVPPTGTPRIVTGDGKIIWQEADGRLTSSDSGTHPAHS